MHLALFVDPAINLSRRGERGAGEAGGKERASMDHVGITFAFLSVFLRRNDLQVAAALERLTASGAGHGANRVLPGEPALLIVEVAHAVEPTVAVEILPSLEAAHEARLGPGAPEPEA